MLYLELIGLLMETCDRPRTCDIQNKSKSSNCGLIPKYLGLYFPAGK